MNVTYRLKLKQVLVDERDKLAAIGAKATADTPRRRMKDQAAAWARWVVSASGIQVGGPVPTAEAEMAMSFVWGAFHWLAEGKPSPLIAEVRIAREIFAREFGFPEPVARELADTYKQLHARFQAVKLLGGGKVPTELAGMLGTDDPQVVSVWIAVIQGSLEFSAWVSDCDNYPHSRYKDMVSRTEDVLQELGEGPAKAAPRSSRGCALLLLFAVLSSVSLAWLI